MTKKHFPKLFLSTIMLFLLCVVVAGCSNGSRVPTEGINADSVYLSNGTVKVTNGDLYKNLKTTYGLDILTEAINKVVFKDEIAEYYKDPTNEIYKKYFEYFVDKDCYSQTDKTKVDAFTTEERAKAQKAFLDNLKTYNLAIDFTTSADGEYDVYQKAVADYYIVSIAVAIYSYKMAEKEFAGLIELGSTSSSEGIKDIYSESDLTDAIKKEIEDAQTKKIVDYYTSKVENRGDMLGLLIKFNNTNEYQDTIKLLRLKTQGGVWYQIPYKDVTDFDSYYANYAINKDTDKALTDAEIFAYFIIMFNFINSYRSSIVYDMGWSSTDDIDILVQNISKDVQAGKDVVASIVADCADASGNIKYGTVDEKTGEYTASDFIAKLLSKDEKGFFTIEYDEYYSSYFSIYNHFFSTLKTTGQRFSTNYITISEDSTDGNQSVFLGFKLAENEKIKLYDEETVKTTDDDGEETETTKYTFVNDDLKKEIIGKILAERVENIIYNDYSGMVKSRYTYDKIFSKKQVKIYDQDLQTLYSLSNTNYKKTSASSKASVAVINGQEITAKELSETLISRYGAIVSVSLAFDGWLVNAYDEGRFDKEITKSQFKTACENVYTSYMYYFANGTDNVTSHSLPASIGKKAYIQLAFNSSTMKEAIEYYVKPLVLKQLFFGNLDQYYTSEATTGLKPFEVLAEYASNVYNDYFSLTMRNLLITIDMDNKVEQEDPREYVASLTEAEATEFKALVCEFADKIATYVNGAKTKETGLTNFITEYNKASRFDTTWGKFRKAGLFVTLEESATYTNTSSLVPEFYDHLIEVYTDASHWSTVEEPKYVKGDFLPFFDHEVGTSYDNLLVTKYGYHLELFTAAANRSDCRFDSTEEKYQNITFNYKNQDSEIYKTSKVENINNTNATPSANQIEVYVRDYELYSASNLNLPTSIYTAVKASFSDVYTRYTSSTHRTMIIMQVLSKSNFQFASNDVAKLCDEITDITVKQLDSYAKTEDNLYNNWFEAFGLNVKFAK